MKIKSMQILWSFNNGGMELIARNLFLKNSNKKFKTYFCVINNDIDHNAFRSINDNEIIQINRKRGSRNIFKIVKLYYEIFKIKPHILHIHSYNLIKVLLPLKKILKLKVVLTIHGMNDFDRSIELADKVLAVSKYHYKNIKHSCNSKKININNLGYIYNGIQLPNEISDEINLGNNFSFFCIGRLNHLQKRQDYILKIFKEINEKFKGCNLTFYGAGDSLNYLKNIRSDYNLAKNVHFRGSINNEDLKKEVLEHNIMISASKVETFGLNILESLSLGIPVIAFENPTIKEISKNNPLLFIFNNKKQFLNILENQILKVDNQKREESFKMVNDNFSIDLMIKNYNSLYLKLL